MSGKGLFAENQIAAACDRHLDARGNHSSAPMHRLFFTGG
jgi:hypothetical protein